MLRRFRFSLRTLLILSITAACAMQTVFRSEPWPSWMRIPGVANDEGFADFEFSPDNRKLLVWSQHYVQIWDLDTKQRLSEYEPAETIVNAVWAGTDRVLLAGARRHVFVLDGTHATLQGTIGGDSDPQFMSDVAATSDGARFITHAKPKNTVELWDINGQRPLTTLSECWFSGFSLDGKYFLLRRGVTSIEVRDAADGKLLAQFSRPGSELMTEGWTFEPGRIHLVEAELSDAVATDQDGKPFPFLRQRLHWVDLEWRNGVLTQLNRTFFVEEQTAARAYNSSVQYSRKGSAADGRGIHSMKEISAGGKSIHPLPDIWENEPPFDKSDFSPSAAYVACVRQSGAAETRVQVWRNRRPEAWWGMLWLPEAWLTLATLAFAFISFRRDEKIRRDPEIAPMSAASNESNVPPEQTPVAKAV